MGWTEKFFDLAYKNKKQFSLMVHTHSDIWHPTLIEVTSHGHLLVRVEDEDEDHAYERAFEDLEFKIEIRQKTLEKYLDRRRENERLSEQEGAYSCLAEEYGL